MVVMWVIWGGISYAKNKEIKNVKEADLDYKREMIALIKDIKLYSKEKRPSFQVIGNNALGLVKPNDVQESTLGDKVDELSDSLDGILLEGLFYSWEISDEKERSVTSRQYLQEPLTALLIHKWPVFNIDYCQKPEKVDKSYKMNEGKGIVSTTANRLLDSIPSYPIIIHNENNNNIDKLKQGKNILVLLNPRNFANKETYLRSLQKTNYDVLIIDMAFNGSLLSVDDVNTLILKNNGGSRLVFAYMSVGEAADYRAYWKPSWYKDPPKWVAEKNPAWMGAYKVKYWDVEWKKILLGSEKSNLDMILTAGFSGVFLDLIDAYQYFEQ